MSTDKVVWAQHALSPLLHKSSLYFPYANTDGPMFLCVPVGCKAEGAWECEVQISSISSLDMAIIDQSDPQNLWLSIKRYWHLISHPTQLHLDLDRATRPFFVATGWPSSRPHKWRYKSVERYDRGCAAGKAWFVVRLC